MKSLILRSTNRDDCTVMGATGDEGCVEVLNNRLSILATVFPYVRPEVFREMLITFEGQSSLHIVLEQLLKHPDRWVKGRWRAHGQEAQTNPFVTQLGKGQIAAEDKFRRADYQNTTRNMLHEEFKMLSRSKIEAVLAEENFCYSRARTTLQRLASKSWRATFSSLLAKWRKPVESSTSDHFMLTWCKTEGSNVQTIPILRETGNHELDLELRQHVLQPLLEMLIEQRGADDWENAMALNEEEAKKFDATYECECCYSETTFEQMACCSSDLHIICFRCIWQAVSEALFGQSWGQNIDHVYGQIKCLAPVSEMSCEGHIPPDSTRRAVLQFKGGNEALTRLEVRLAQEDVLKSHLPLVHCPFCMYVEVDELYFPPDTIQYRLNMTRLKMMLPLLVVMLIILPLLIVYSALLHCPPFRAFPHLKNMFSRSLDHVSRTRHLSRRFRCRSHLCGLQSCLSCLKVWHDPHICHESAMVSLRTTIEAARTAALKRICPRCGLSFVKDSGCNRLTCICGYSMCYICRQGLDRGHGGESYRHFCQHFRLAGGACKECSKCDLYKNEDDESLICKAGAQAEKEWREKQGMMATEGTRVGIEQTTTKTYYKITWTAQRILDWWVERLVTC